MTDTVPEAVVHPTTRSCPFDPPDGLGQLREERPLTRMRYPDGHVGWLVTGHALAREVLADPRFGSRGDLLRAPVPLAMAQPHSEIPPGMFTAMDPPEHTRYRRKLAGGFTVRRMRLLEPRITQVVEEHLDRMQDGGGPVDLVSAFAVPVSLRVISELLGVPAEQQHRFLEATEVVFTMGADAEQVVAGWEAMRALLLELVEIKRSAPAEDLLSTLVADGELTDQELITVGTLLIMAGHDTSANMLALGAHALLQNPAELAELQADPALLDGAVEELLRYLTVPHVGSIRAALADFEFHGESIKFGDVVTLSLAAANRDPAQFPDPDVLDVSRRATGHLAFGHGVHQCVGAQLARIELRVGFGALLRRFPTLRLAVPPEEVEMRHDMIIYGVRSLPVTW
ncbi:cytochrome P450 [Saccharopolyspora sp. NPDC000359]|uniref:cytochrome P450 n=1 Tax=Saccharopolyspora sp. NPDC000359 TaxID=3154251 RepID=UPI003317C55B